MPPIPGIQATWELRHTPDEQEINEANPLDIFNIIDKVGEGSYGSVFHAIYRPNGLDVAIKAMNKKTLMKDNNGVALKNELDVMAAKPSDHSNIITTYGIVDGGSEVYTIMEFCGLGDVSTLLALYKTIPLTWAQYIAREVLVALMHLDSMGFIHRDVKPANIALTLNGGVRLIDFGTVTTRAAVNEAVASSFDPTSRERKGPGLVGTLLYMAPEVYVSTGESKASDIWALGCVLYQMLVGKTPFEGNGGNLVCRIAKDKVVIPPNLPKFCQDFIKRCLEKDPGKRLGSVGGWDEVFGHPFILSFPSNVPPPFDTRTILSDVKRWHEIKKVQKMARVRIAYSGKELEVLDTATNTMKRFNTAFRPSVPPFATNELYRINVSGLYQVHLEKHEYILFYTTCFHKGTFTDTQYELLITNMPRLLLINLKNSSLMGSGDKPGDKIEISLIDPNFVFKTYNEQGHTKERSLLPSLDEPNETEVSQQLIVGTDKYQPPKKKKRTKSYIKIKYDRGKTKELYFDDDGMTGIVEEMLDMARQIKPLGDEYSVSAVQRVVGVGAYHSYANELLPTEAQSSPTGSMAIIQGFRKSRGRSGGYSIMDSNATCESYKDYWLTPHEKGSNLKKELMSATNLAMYNLGFATDEERSRGITSVNERKHTQERECVPIKVKSVSMLRCVGMEVDYEHEHGQQTVDGLLGVREGEGDTITCDSVEDDKGTKRKHHTEVLDSVWAIQGGEERELQAASSSLYRQFKGQKRCSEIFRYCVDVPIYNGTFAAGVSVDLLGKLDDCLSKVERVIEEEGVEEVERKELDPVFRAETGSDDNKKEEMQEESGAVSEQQTNKSERCQLPQSEVSRALSETTNTQHNKFNQRPVGDKALTLVNVKAMKVLLPTDPTGVSDSLLYRPYVWDSLSEVTYIPKTHIKQYPSFEVTRSKVTWERVLEKQGFKFNYPQGINREVANYFTYTSMRDAFSSAINADICATPSVGYINQCTNCEKNIVIPVRTGESEPRRLPSWMTEVPVDKGRGMIGVTKYDIGTPKALLSQSLKSMEYKDNLNVSDGEEKSVDKLEVDPEYSCDCVVAFEEDETLDSVKEEIGEMVEENETVGGGETDTNSG